MHHTIYATGSGCASQPAALLLVFVAAAAAAVVAVAVAWERCT